MSGYRTAVFLPLLVLWVALFAVLAGPAAAAADDGASELQVRPPDVREPADTRPTLTPEQWRKLFGTISRERGVFRTAGGLEDYLRPEPHIPSDNPEIVDLARKLTAGMTSDTEKLWAIYAWVVDNIEYDYSYTIWAPLEVLHKRKGVCSGYSYLLASLLRAAGVPCKYVSGAANGVGGWPPAGESNHAWNEVYVGGRWWSVDVTWDSCDWHFLKENQTAPVPQLHPDQLEYYLVEERPFSADHHKILSNRLVWDYKGDEFDLELWVEEPGAAIYYTLDGSEPTTASARYTQPIHITNGTVVKAIAVVPQGVVSYLEMPFVYMLPPVVLRTDPEKGATGVSVGSIIVITFNKPVEAGPSFGQIELKGPGLYRVRLSVQGDKLIIDPGGSLAFVSIYTVNIPAGAVQDMAGNTLAQDYTFSFTTAPGDPVLSVDPDNVDFGATEAGLPVRRTVTLHNDGAADLILENVTSSFSHEFSVDKSTCAGLRLRPGEKHEITISFCPRSAGEKTGYIFLTSNDPRKPYVSIALRGTGLPGRPPVVLRTDPENGATGVPVGGIIVVIFNKPVEAGPSFGQIELKGPGLYRVRLSVQGDKLIIDPGGSLAFVSIYTVNIPAGAVKDLAGNTLAQDYTFSFMTAGDPVLSVDPLSVDFGTTEAGMPVRRTVTLRNDGWADLILEDVTFTSEFSVDENTRAGLRLGPGEKHEITISFCPRSAGEKNDYIILTSNDPKKRYCTITLRGTALPGRPPVVLRTDPENGATGVPVGEIIVVIFNKPVEAGPNFGQIEVKGPGLYYLRFSVQGDKLIIDSRGSLAFASVYTVHIPTEAVQDLAGNTLAQDYTFSFTTAAARKKGDVNGDGQVNVLDVVRTVNIALGRIQPTDEERYAADANGDGVINVLDVVRIVNMALGKG